jgi:hypothetical protein
MIGTLLGLIFLVVILGVAWWAFQQFIGLVTLGEPFATILRVLFVIVGVVIVLYVAQELLAAGGINVPWPRLN